MPFVRAFSGTGGTSTNSGAAIGFTWPALSGHVKDDDLAIAIVTVNDRGANANITSSASGWTFIGKSQSGESATAVFYKRVVAVSDTGAVTPFTWSSSDSSNDSACCYAIIVRDVDWTVGPIQIDSITTGSGTDHAAMTMPTLTSTRQNSLAVCGIGYTDEGATAISEATGASGGTWYFPTYRGNSTAGADDVACNLHIAELATPGTISGGTINQGVTTPQSSKWTSVSFIVIGKEDNLLNSTLVTSAPAASADDASENTGTTVVTVNGTTLNINSLIGLRFPNLAELDSRTIDRVELQVTANTTSTASQNAAVVKIQTEAADTPAQYAASNTNISARSLDANAPEFQVAHFVANERTLKQRFVIEPEGFQAAVDRASYGGVIALVIAPGTGAGQQRVFAAQDHASLTEPTLSVWYH